MATGKNNIRNREKIPAKIRSKPILHIAVRILYRNEKTTLGVFSTTISSSKNCTYYTTMKMNVKTKTIDFQLSLMI